ncbi:MAG: CAP domain-containing protein [Acidimicrobiia bacterium]|nr:CAP domain-containing protein [Acidimicrobiia bacterium]
MRAARVPTQTRREERARAPRISVHARRAAALLAAISMAVGAMAAVPAAAQDARYLGSVAGSQLDRPIVGMAATPTGRGYWLVASDGGIFAFGDARFHGSTGGTLLNRPIVGMASTRTGNGYWLVASDGGIFAFGDARFHGSTGGTPINRPIVGMASTRTGNGYWLVASDGGIFAFGDARFHGSTGGIALNRPIVAMASTRTGNGYWLVASDGGIFAFGDARFHGSTGGIALVSPIVAMASTRAGSGYWMIASDGGIFAFGDARFYGSAAGQPATGTIASMAASPRGGYWMVTADGAVLTATRAAGFKTDPNLAALSPEASVARDLFYRINDERAARGLRTLTWDPVLADLAAGWARRMATEGRMYHQNLQGLFGTPLVAGRFTALRENIYTGNGIYRDSGSTHVAFMSSDPHRADILVPELTSVGVGAACVNGTLWVTQDFGVVAGYPAPAPAPVPPRDPIVRPDENGPSC